MLQPADPYTWRRVVRRCRLGPATKLVATVLSEYADPDGTRVHPGVDRLARVTDLGEKTVRRALDRLRGLQLVERVVEGSKHGRRGLADEYRLTLPPLDFLAGRVEMLAPDERPVDNRPAEAVENPGSPVTVTDDPDEEHRSLVPRTPVTGDGTPVTVTAHLTRTTPNHSPTTLTSPKYGGAVEGNRARARSPPDIHSRVDPFDEGPP